MSKIWYWAAPSRMPINRVVRSEGTMAEADSGYLISCKRPEALHVWPCAGDALYELAWSILYDTSKYRDLASDLAQQFADDILCQLPAGRWHLDQGTVKAWISVVSQTLACRIITDDVNREGR